MANYYCSFDGACAPINPCGHMGIGGVIVTEDSEVIFENSHYIEASEENSNNLAEYLAFQSVLEELLGISNTKDKIEIVGDSKLVVMQMNKKWAIKEGRYVSVALECLGLLNELKQRCKVKLYWIPRQENSYADELSNRGFIQRGIKPFVKPKTKRIKKIL